MKLPIVLFVFLASILTVWADQAVENAQQALKEQGFYYGEVNGEKDADTTAAIRRYQIRNGLQVTGDLNNETIKSLGVGSGPQQPAAKPSPAGTPDNGDLHSEPREPRQAPQSTRPTNPLTGQPFPDVSQDRQRSPNDYRQLPPDAYRQPPPDYRQPPPNDYRQLPPDDYRQPPPDYNPMGSRPGGIFAGTPFEMAPPEVQRNVVTSAEAILGQRGLYRGDIDGVFGPNLEFSLRAYQSRVGIPVTGRLDLQTLAALQLLPGPNGPGRGLRPPTVPPVRGEWIREP